MNILLKPLQLLYTFWAGVSYFVFVLIGFPLFFILHLFLEDVRAHRILMLGYANWWARVWAFLCGIRMEVVKNANIKKKEAYIFVANHNSNLDAMLWVYSVDNLSKGLAKKEVLDFPLLGYLFKKTCVIVDRVDKESRKRSFDSMKKQIKNGISIFIFPEGTRNKTVLPLLPFRDGAFRIAIDLQKPIAPVVMLNTGVLMPARSSFYKPGNVKCIFLDPISTEGMTAENVEELKSKTFALMERVVLENEVVQII